MRVVLTRAVGALGIALRKACVDAGSQVVCIAHGATPYERRPLKWFPCSDLADETANSKAVGDANDWLGGFDALIHVAGMFGMSSIAEAKLSDLRNLFSANCETALMSIKSSLPFLAEGSSIVVVGAAAARPAGNGMGAYAASKSSLLSLVEALSFELAPRNIWANAVLPSIIDTPNNRLSMPTADWKEWTSLEAIADSILFLADCRSRVINGASIPVTNRG